jgi:iron complex outermembrane recepter protein
MRNSSVKSTRLRAGVSVLALVVSLSSAPAFAQTADIGTVDIDSARPAASSSAAASNEAPITSDAAIGANAPVGSAPALAVGQQSLNATEPGSIVSGKIIRDVVIPTGDYNETAKFTPNFVSSNPNGPIGDSKASWRGFQDGQYNITFDGVPFGDANDPTHHSAAYFPSAFLGKVVIDRGPGQASQAGYATFGGTMALNSLALSDTFGGNIQAGFGNFGTNSQSVTVQSGYNKEFQTRALFQYAHGFTQGQYDYGHYNQNNFLLKVEKQLGEVTATVFATYGTEEYNNVGSITWPQWQKYGKNYGAVNANPKSQQYYGYNNSQKQTDMEYIDLKGDFLGFHIDNKAYTYSYWYPNYQNNGANQSIEGNASIANGGTITSVKVPQPNGSKTTVKFGGIKDGDVTGYLKYNDYRAYGDLLAVDRDIIYGPFSGQLRFGAWFEHVENGRLQQYIDYTSGALYSSLPQTTKPYSNAANYKLKLDSNINNVQPYIEYEWKPTDRLSITPGYKFESFTRIHDAQVNQTTLAVMSYSHTYTSNLPYLTVRYKIDDNWSVFGQASQGFLAPTVSAYYVFDPASNNIQAQQTTNYQIGAVYKSGDITADVALYHIRATNFPIVTTLNTGLQIYQNGGTAQYQGAEFEGTWAFGHNIGMNGFALTGSAGLSNAKYVQGQFTGMAVGNAPNYTVAGGLIYDDNTFFGSLLEKVTGSQYGSNGQKAWSATTNAGLNSIPAYTSTDFVAGYRYKLPENVVFGKSVEIKLGVQNIFDHRAITDISGDPTGLTSINNTTLNYTFQSGRYVYGAVKYSF